MTLIAFDDTDSRSGMCTTYLMAQFILRVQEMGIGVIGYPRLVRLNPNIPYKTRGNGALCVELGIGKKREGLGTSKKREEMGIKRKRGELGTRKNGEEIGIGEWKGEQIMGYRRGGRITDSTTLDQLFRLACALVEEFAEFDAEGTDPGVVMFPERPEYGGSYYRKGVREVLTMDDAERFVQDHRGLIRTFKSGRGIIGASAACAWEPADSTGRTYEIISYRDPSRFGTQRKIDKESVIRMDGEVPSTFNNYDERNDHIAIAPSSPCPVLHAIRGEDPEELRDAAGIIRTMDGEKPEGWMIFLTNQGTDDHLRVSRIDEVRPYQSVIVGGIVRSGPKELPGGHVKVTIDDKTGTIDCIAYEPTKEFRQTIRELRPDDAIMACGGVREEPFSVNLEKIKVIGLTERVRKVSNPVCPECGKSMKSVGAGQGYRCRTCGTKAGEGRVEYERYEAGIRPGWYEVPVCARRHLHKPLKRFD
jgi:tRNA(Ile2)-agmatinylcytidine synthase